MLTVLSRNSLLWCFGALSHHAVQFQGQHLHCTLWSTPGGALHTEYNVNASPSSCATASCWDQTPQDSRAQLPATKPHSYCSFPLTVHRLGSQTYQWTNKTLVSKPPLLPPAKNVGGTGDDAVFPDVHHLEFLRVQWRCVLMRKADL